MVDNKLINMKKVIILALCFFALKANSQLVDTTVKNVSIAVKIQPKYYYSQSFPQTVDTITHFGIFQVVLDTDTTCKVNYALINHTQKKNIVVGWYTLTPAEFNNKGDAWYDLLPILANRFGLIFKNN